MTASGLPVLSDSPYVGYSYAYPHKTAYRALDPAMPLTRIWRDERRDALFCYIHIPFCEMRCGFCNLFTTSVPESDMVEDYLSALERQVEAVQQALPDAQYARFAVGGGTPTYLTAPQLERVFALLAKLGVDPAVIPGSVETSPATATEERIGLLRAMGVSRVSIGVQTFFEAESKLLGRTERSETLHRALERLHAANFPCLNIDLMYGGEGQTVASFVESIKRALEYEPQEIYLYPLYVRPLTGLAKLGRDWDDARLRCYRAGRDLLRERGYRQVSMRMFQQEGSAVTAGPAYCCQRDGMVGLGCGARSYTTNLHYATRYGVARSSVREILAGYMSPRADFREANHGFWLDTEERKRRYIIMSLLQAGGIDLAAYRRLFGSDPQVDIPYLDELVQAELAEQTPQHLRLTDKGLELSDAIGPRLYSTRVAELSEEYAWT